MVSEENPNHPREKVTAAPPAADRKGESVKAAPATAATAVAAAAAAGVAQGARAASAPAARPSYVPARRRSRRNLLL